MKRIVMAAAAMILSAVLLLTLGERTFSAEEDVDIATLSARVDRHLSLYEYGKAVKLIEKYPDITADPAFDKAKNILLVHFTEIAKGYYNETERYIVRQETYGNETISDQKGRLSPENFKEHLTAEEMTAFDRVVITRQKTEEERYAHTTVKIEIFGKTTVYPPEDITLDKRTKVTNEYTDSAALLEDVKTNIGIYRYAAAVKLLEENPRLSSKPEFDDVKAELLVYFTEEARQMYISAATYVTKQEVMGYPLDDGCEGYDRENRRLDPGALSGFMSFKEKVLVNRVSIICTNEKDVDFKVKINFCGMTAYYPANDAKI